MNGSSQTSILDVRLLGDFNLTHGDEAVTGVNTPRLQSLLAYLVLHRDAPQSRHHLAFQFWPDSTEAQALTNLRNQLHYLRRALPDADRFVQIDAQTVQWRPDGPFRLDVGDFQSALAQSKQAGDPFATRKLLEESTALYQGHLVPSCYDDWILPERERLQEEFTGALERLITLLEEGREYPAAISFAQQLVRHDPLHEVGYLCLMRLHALSGDRASALRAYHTCSTVLQRELGVDPGPTTREAYERLLQTDVAPTVPSPPPAAISSFWPMVGRTAEWAQLRETWRAASAGGPLFALITGESGIGKARLAEELAQWASRQGIATASAHCHAVAGDLAFAPAVAWLRARPAPSLEPVWRAELVQLLPELQPGQAELSPPVPRTSALRRQRLFEALARAILGSRAIPGGPQPLLLLLTGLQWCDQETLELIHYLLRFDPAARLLIVGTCRLEETVGDRRLSSLLRDLRRDGQLREIELHGLDQAETKCLAESVAGREISQLLATCIYHETEGNPLFVVETVRAGLPDEVQETDSGALVCLPRPLPPRMQDALADRLTQLSPSARELAEVAATIGREFTFAVLARASALGEESLVRALDELWRRQIVCEQGVDAYDFGHDQLRQVTYASLSTARRRYLHGRVANALEAQYAGNLGPVSALIARHLEGAGLSEQAGLYHRRAAETAGRSHTGQDTSRSSP